MGGLLSTRKYGDPLGKKEFQAAAEHLMESTEEEYAALDKCINYDTRNLPVNMRCQQELGVWNGKVLQAFCNRLYDKAVTCQKKAGNDWPKECKPEMNEVMHCGDDAMRRLLQFNLERKQKEDKKTVGAKAA